MEPAQSNLAGTGPPARLLITLRDPIPGQPETSCVVSGSTVDVQVFLADHRKVCDARLRIVSADALGDPEELMELVRLHEQRSQPRLPDDEGASATAHGRPTQPILDHTTATLISVLPPSNLIPVPAGIDPAEVAGPIQDEAAQPSHLARLSTSSIAVKLGTTDGLLAARFRNEGAMERFLAANPRARATLATGHGDATILWWRSPNPYLGSLELPDVLVRMSGNLLVFNRFRATAKDRILHLASPQLVDLESIDWGADPEGRIDSWLARVRHGPFSLPDARGSLRFNRSAWRHYLARRLRGVLVFEPHALQFHRATADGNFAPVTEDQVTEELCRLARAAPVDSRGVAPIITSTRLRGLVRLLRADLQADLGLAEARFREFALDRVVRSAGGTVTTQEMYTAFLEQCESEGRPTLPAGVFRRLGTRILAESPWRLALSHSIQRASGGCRGYRNVKLDPAGALRDVLRPPGNGG
jgi:hypothetical protein